MHGKIATSVTTAVTNSGGVMSYFKLSGVKCCNDSQFDSKFDLFDVDTISDGLPKIKRRKFSFV